MQKSVEINVKSKKYLYELGTKTSSNSIRIKVFKFSTKQKCILNSVMVISQLF